MMYSNAARELIAAAARSPTKEELLTHMTALDELAETYVEGRLANASSDGAESDLVGVAVAVLDVVTQNPVAPDQAADVADEFYVSRWFLNIADRMARQDLDAQAAKAAVTRAAPVLRPLLAQLLSIVPTIPRGAESMRRAYVRLLRDAASDAGERELEVRCLATLVHASHRDPVEAASLGQRALDIIESSGDAVEFRPLLLHCIGVALLDQGDPIGAVRCWTELLEIDGSDTAPFRYGALENLAALAKKRGDLNESAAFLQRILEDAPLASDQAQHELSAHRKLAALAEQGRDRREWARQTYQAARTARRMGDETSAVALTDTLLSFGTGRRLLRSTLPDPDPDLDPELAALLEEPDKADLASVDHGRVKPLAIALLAKAGRLLGDLHERNAPAPAGGRERRGEVAQSSKTAWLALALCAHLDEPALAAGVHTVLGEIGLAQGNLNAAVEHVQEAYRLRTTATGVRAGPGRVHVSSEAGLGLARALYNAGTLLIATGEPEFAAHMVGSAHSMLVSGGAYADAAEAILAQGDAATLSSDEVVAAALFEKALALALEHDLIETEARARKQLLPLSYAAGNTEAAVGHGDALLGLPDRGGDSEDGIRLTQSLMAASLAKSGGARLTAGENERAKADLERGPEALRAARRRAALRRPPGGLSHQPRSACAPRRARWNRSRHLDPGGGTRVGRDRWSDPTSDSSPH